MTSKNVRVGGVTCRYAEDEGPNAEAVVDGKTWRRAVNVGPEGWRERGWAEVVAFVVPKA